MSAPSSGSRPPSQPSRDQLLLQVENVALAGRLLAIEIFELQNVKATPPSPLRSTPQPSTPPPSARATGFRVAARDDVENEYSLFVTRQKAEYLYRAAYPGEAASNDVIGSEAMANGILAHLNIIGNRQRDVGKLVCREPEPHFEKKTRVLPATTPPDKQKNPHLLPKRQDQRAIRVQKTSKRAMEAVAQAMSHLDADLSGDDESEVEPGRFDRKSSEASLLHRMAVADSKTMWKAELETNYEEPDNASLLLEDDTDSNFHKTQYDLPPGLSPVKRALPERKTKHKDLEERRQKGRHQRVLIAQATQEAPSSTLLNSISPYATLLEEAEQDGSRRSSMMNIHGTEKPTIKLRASSAPRSSSCVVVGNAYGLKNLHESETSEPEQFLRRRTLGAHRSVLRKDNWHDDIPGMGIEITAERPILQTPPNRLDALLGTARRVMLVNAVGSRIISNATLLPENEPTSTSTKPMLSLYSAALGASHSAPVPQSPKLVNECPINDQPEQQAPTAKPLISDENTTGDYATGIHVNTTAEPSMIIKSRTRSKSTSVGPNAMAPASSENQSQVTLSEAATPQAPSTVEPSNRDHIALAQPIIRPRSNSVGSERIVRLAPLPSTTKPDIQEFLAEPEIISLVESTDEAAIKAEMEVPVLHLDPEVVLCPSSDLPTDMNEDFSLDKSEECPSCLPAVVGPISPQCFEELFQADENALLLAVDDGVAGIMKSESNEARLDATANDTDPPPTTRQACWEEPVTVLVISPEVIDENMNDSVDDDAKQTIPEIDNATCGVELSPVEECPNEAIVTEAAEVHDADFPIVAEDSIAKEGGYQIKNGIEASGDVSHEMQVVQEVTGTTDTVQRQGEKQDSSVNIIADITNGPSTVEEDFSPQTDASELHEQSLVNDDDKLSDAMGDGSGQSDSSTLSEGTSYISSALGIDNNAERVEYTGQETDKTSDGDAVDSTERSKSSETIAEGGNPTESSEAAGDDDNNSTPVNSSNHDLCAEITVATESDRSEEFVRATAFFGQADNTKLDADACCADVLAMDLTISHPHQAPSPDTEVTSLNTTVIVGDERDSEGSNCNDTFAQNMVQEAETSSFHEVPPETLLDIKEEYPEPSQTIFSDQKNNATRSDQPHIAVSSSEHDKSSKISRRKSLSPSKKIMSTTDVNQAKPATKVLGSRRRSTIVQVADTQVETPQSSNLARRRTEDDVKRRGRSTRRTSIVDQSESLPGLASSTAGKPDVKVSVEKEQDEVLLRPHSKRSVPSKRQSTHSSGLPQNVSNYHKKWGKWIVGRNIIEKVGCLQLEDLVIADPRDDENLLKLGLRYTKGSGTSLAGILILEHAVLLQKTPSRTQDYWFWLGSAHLDIFMRHRKYLPVAHFHLSKSIWAFTSAFAYMDSLADPVRLLRYAISLFWHKGDGNLEKTRDIFHELFSRFVHFCDKDLPNLLFLQFQVFHRLKLYVDAIDCMNRIVNLHENLPQQGVSGLSSTNVMTQFSVYDAADYRLMLMQCQQASGDYVSAAQSLATVLKLKSVQQETTLKDEEYFDLWSSLAEKSFHHEDYALALEYYAIALNFAKQSQVLATIHYNLGLCFQSLGEDNKCVTEYKRARTANRHVPPLVSLAELSAPYEERFALQLQKSVGQIVEEVRVDLYGKAVKRLQRVFRQSRSNRNLVVASNSSDIPSTKMPSISKRRQSVLAAQNPSTLIKIEDTAEETDANEEESVQQKPVIVGDNQVSRLEDGTHESVERRRESFLARKQAAMDNMAELLTNPQYRGREMSPQSQPKARVKADTQLRSKMLSPEKDRLDIRRKQSMEAFRQLGYVSSAMPWIEFWGKLLALAPELYESRQALYGSITRIRGQMPLVTDEVAFCALAENIGNVHKAAEKLHDASYERELTYVCAVIDVSKQLERAFPLESTHVSVKNPHASLPTISSPRAGHSPAPFGATTARRVVLPPYSPARTAPTLTSKPQKHLRMNEMLNLHFQEHVQQQEAAIAITEATGGPVQPHRRMEKLKVLQDFRQTNDVLLRSQLAFGSGKAAS